MIEGLLKQSTARNVTVLLIDSADHITGKTGLTLSITASKDGGAFASVSPTVTELANGWYELAFTTSHTDTLGDLALHISATGADPRDAKWQVVTLLPGDAVTVGTNNDKTGYGLAADQAVNVTKVNGTAQTARDLGAQLDATVSSRLASISYTAPDNADITAIKAKTDNLPVSPAATGDAMTLTTAYDPAKTAAQAGDAMALTSGERTTLAGVIWAALTSGLTTVGSIGKRITDNLDAAISSRSTYAGADTAGTTTLLTRIPGTVEPQTGDAYARLGAPAGASVSADIAAVQSESDAIKAKTDNLPASPAATGDIPTADANADALLDRADAVETGWTPRMALRILLATLGGKLSGAGTGTETFRNATDTKDRVVATTDSDGNRSAVTLDGS